MPKSANSGESRHHVKGHDDRTQAEIGKTNAGRPNPPVHLSRTGVLLKFVYEPTPVEAYASIQTLLSGVPFGRMVRNMHHWGAHLLVVIVFLHMMRVFFTGAFHPPRQFNWIVGLALFCTVLAANLTGYLLPWDQLAYWAVTVSTGMLKYIPLIRGAA